MIKTFENVLKPSYAILLQNQILNTNEVNWNWVENTAYNHVSQQEEWNFSWVHHVYNDNQILSNLYSYLMPLILDLADSADLLVEDIGRIRIGGITQTPENIIHTPHIDLSCPHYTACFYINDSDGDTIIYNEVYPFGYTNIPHDEYAYSLNFTELHRHQPKFNSAVLFDGAHYHSSTSPSKNARRVVITMNFTARQKDLNQL